MHDEPVGFWPYLFWQLLPRFEVVAPPTVGWLGFGIVCPAAPVVGGNSGSFAAHPRAGIVNGRYLYPAAVLVGYVEKAPIARPPRVSSFAEIGVLPPTAGHLGKVLPSPAIGGVFSAED